MALRDLRPAKNSHERLRRMLAGLLPATPAGPASCRVGPSAGARTPELPEHSPWAG